MDESAKAKDEEQNHPDDSAAASDMLNGDYQRFLYPGLPLPPITFQTATNIKPNASTAPTDEKKAPKKYDGNPSYTFQAATNIKPNASTAPTDEKKVPKKFDGNPSYTSHKPYFPSTMPPTMPPSLPPTMHANQNGMNMNMAQMAYQNPMYYYPQYPPQQQYQAQYQTQSQYNYSYSRRQFQMQSKSQRYDESQINPMRQGKDFNSANAGMISAHGNSLNSSQSKYPSQNIQASTVGLNSTTSISANGSARTASGPNFNPPLVRQFINNQVVKATPIKNETKTTELNSQNQARTKQITEHNSLNKSSRTDPESKLTKPLISSFINNDPQKVMNPANAIIKDSSTTYETKSAEKKLQSQAVSKQAPVYFSSNKSDKIDESSILKTAPKEKQPSFIASIEPKKKMPSVTLNPITNLTKAQLANLPVVFAYRLDDDGTSESIAISKTIQYKADLEANKKKRSAEGGDSLSAAKRRKAEREALALNGNIHKYKSNVLPLEQDPSYPPGWMVELVERRAGDTVGRVDKYWYSPVTKKKFRSRVEVSRFINLIEFTKGDENLAFKYLKQPQLLKNILKEGEKDEKLSKRDTGRKQKAQKVSDKKSPRHTEKSVRENRNNKSRQSSKKPLSTPTSIAQTKSNTSSTKPSSKRKESKSPRNKVIFTPSNSTSINSDKKSSKESRSKSKNTSQSKLSKRKQSLISPSNKSTKRSKQSDSQNTETNAFSHTFVAKSNSFKPSDASSSECQRTEKKVKSFKKSIGDKESISGKKPVSTIQAYLSNNSSDQSLQTKNSITESKTPTRTKTKPSKDSKNSSTTKNSASKQKKTTKLRPKIEENSLFKIVKKDPCQSYLGPAPRLEKGWILQIITTTPLVKERLWYSPKERLKFKTMGDVKKFQAALQTVNGDEKKAYAIRSSSKM